MEADSQTRDQETSSEGFNVICGSMSPLIDNDFAQPSPSDAAANFTSDHGEFGSSSGSCPSMLNQVISQPNFTGFNSADAQYSDVPQENTPFFPEPGPWLFTPESVGLAQNHGPHMVNRPFATGNGALHVGDGTLPCPNLFHEGNLISGSLENSSANSSTWPQLDLEPPTPLITGAPESYFPTQNAEMGFTGGSNGFFPNLSSPARVLNQFGYSNLDHIAGNPRLEQTRSSLDLPLGSQAHALPYPPTSLGHQLENFLQTDRVNESFPDVNWMSLNQSNTESQNAFQNNHFLNRGMDLVDPGSNLYADHLGRSIGNNQGLSNHLLQTGKAIDDGRSSRVDMPQQSNWFSLNHNSPCGPLTPSGPPSNVFLPVTNTLNQQYCISPSMLPGSSMHIRPHVSDQPQSLLYNYDLEAVRRNQIMSVESNQGSKRGLIEAGETSSSKRSRTEATTEEGGPLLLTPPQDHLTSQASGGIKDLSKPRPTVRHISVYDPLYEAIGLPIDPHLRLFLSR